MTNYQFGCPNEEVRRASLSLVPGGSISNSLAIADLNGDGYADIVDAGQAVTGYVNVWMGNGDGSFKAANSYQAESSSSNDIALADLNRDGVLDLATGGDGGVGKATVRLSVTRDGISSILPFSLKTQADARQAIPMLKDTSDRLSIQRGKIGAFQSRLHSALSTLSSTVLQYSGAESRIADVDIAEESSTMIKNQILQQSASAVLAQANQSPALALALLKN